MPSRKTSPPPRRRSTGPRAAITPAVAARIFAKLRDGYMFKEACAAAGVSTRIVERRRNPEDPQYDPEFARMCEEAYEAGSVVIFERAAAVGSDDWRFHQWRLAVRDPDTYSKRVTVNSKTSQSINVQIEASLVAAQQIRADPELFDAIMRAREIATTQTLAIAAADADGESDP